MLLVNIKVHVELSKEPTCSVTMKHTNAHGYSLNLHVKLTSLMPTLAVHAN